MLLRQERSRKPFKVVASHLVEIFMELSVAHHIFGLLAQNSIGWCQSQDGLQGPNAKLGLKNIALKLQSHTAGFLSSHDIFPNSSCGFTHMDKGD